MNFKPNPLLYGANEDFFSTFRLAIRVKDTVDYDLLSRSVEKGDGALCGEHSLTFMQSGRGEKYLNAFIEEIHAFDIPVCIIGEERYTFCNTSLLL